VNVDIALSPFGFLRALALPSRIIREPLEAFGWRSTLTRDSTGIGIPYSRELVREMLAERLETFEAEAI
jgi:hypothetical protein